MGDGSKDGAVNGSGRLCGRGLPTGCALGRFDPVLAALLVLLLITGCGLDSSKPAPDARPAQTQAGEPRESTPARTTGSAAAGATAGEAEATEDTPAAEATGQTVQVETEVDFEQRVLKAAKPVLVDFYATWCPPCKALAPILATVAAAYKGRMTFIKVDVDKSSGLARKYGVKAMPTLVVFSKGQEVKRLEGLRTQPQLQKELDSVLTP